MDSSGIGHRLFTLMALYDGAKFGKAFYAVGGVSRIEQQEFWRAGVRAALMRYRVPDSVLETVARECVEGGHYSLVDVVRVIARHAPVAVGTAIAVAGSTIKPHELAWAKSCVAAAERGDKAGRQSLETALYTMAEAGAMARADVKGMLASILARDVTPA